MTIRITASFIEGNVAFERGQVLTLPDELAQQFLDDGRAESADLQTVSASVSGFVPSAPRKKKGRR